MRFFLASLLIFTGMFSLVHGGADTGRQGVNVSFRNEVMAVLSKAGCNMGACHGNKNGKYGFKLSLRGESPEADHHAVTGEFHGRRINPWLPGQSLILAKATGEIPHEGGRRFGRDSRYFAILESWIESGAPDDGDEARLPVSIEVTPSGTQFIEYPVRSLEIRAMVTYEDGRTEDVSDLAVYESSNPIVEISMGGVVQSLQPGETTILVRYLHLQKAIPVAFIPSNPDFVPMDAPVAGFIDQHINRKLEKLKQHPAGRCDDATFMRRAWLDLTGITPPAGAVIPFIESTDESRRHRLIEELMETPEFASFWAQKWADLLKVEEKTLDRKGVMSFYQWIRTGIANDRPLDEFAAGIIAASGSTYTTPPANFYRANRTATERSVAAAQVFLGTRLQCAECHNHPFDRWTQNDYYSWASAFATVDYRVLENRRRDSNDQHEFVGEQVVFDRPDGMVRNPTSGKMALPRALGSEQILPDGAARRETLAEWMTSPDNRQFARVQVNRIWYHLMGRGLVEPVDDFRATNPPSHPRLLEELTDLFIEEGFRIRPVIRAVMNSEAWQRSSFRHVGNPVDDPVNYARCVPGRLSGEQILDSITRALEAPVEFNGYAPGTRAIEIPGVEAIRARYRRPSDGDKFLKVFGKPPRLLSTDEERTCSPTMTQAFQLVSGPLVNELVSRPDNRLSRLDNPSVSPEHALIDLFCAFISRPPTDAEVQHFLDYLNSQPSRRHALEDISWALINSKEFLFRY